jgi:hypothetical protein
MKIPAIVSELADELRALGLDVITWGRRSGFVVIWKKGSQGWSIAAVDKDNARFNMTIEMLRHEVDRCKEINNRDD